MFPPSISQHQVHRSATILYRQPSASAPRQIARPSLQPATCINRTTISTQGTVSTRPARTLSQTQSTKMNSSPEVSTLPAPNSRNGRQAQVIQTPVRKRSASPLPEEDKLPKKPRKIEIRTSNQTALLPISGNANQPGSKNNRETLVSKVKRSASPLPEENKLQKKPRKIEIRTSSPGLQSAVKTFTPQTPLDRELATLQNQYVRRQISTDQLLKKVEGVSLTAAREHVAKTPENSVERCRALRKYGVALEGISSNARGSTLIFDQDHPIFGKPFSGVHHLQGSDIQTLYDSKFSYPTEHPIRQGSSPLQQAEIDQDRILATTRVFRNLAKCDLSHSIKGKLSPLTVGQNLIGLRWTPMVATKA